MKCPCQDEIIVDAELIQPFREVALVDQPAGFVNDDQCEDHPVVALARHIFP